MRIPIVPALAIVILSCLGTGSSLAPLVATAGPVDHPPVVDGTPEARLDLMMRALTRMDPDGVRKQAVFVPAGMVLVGHVVEGRWTVQPVAAPRADVGNPFVKDCDVTDVFYSAPVTTNPLFPAPNEASLGQCQGTPSSGPVNFMELRVTGDNGGWTDVVGDNGEMETGCVPAGSGIGYGAGSIYYFNLYPTIIGAYCYVWSSGALPTEYHAWQASVVNYNTIAGDAYAAYW